MDFTISVAAVVQGLLVLIIGGSIVALVNMRGKIIELTVQFENLKERVDHLMDLDVGIKDANRRLEELLKK